MSVVEVPVFEKPLDAHVRPPGSKSDTIRAMAAAALADGRSHLYTPLRAEDPAAMAAALESLGVAVDYDHEPLTIDGLGGRLLHPERALDANESGLSARILLAIAASGEGAITLTGRGRLPERPMTGLVDVLRSQGVEVSGSNVPITVVGRGHLWGGEIAVDCSKTSQFATALMLVAPTMSNPCTLELVGLAGSAGYLDMTAAMMRRFGGKVQRTVTGFEIANTGYDPTDVVIEPDASAAVYPMAMAAVTGGAVTIDGLGASSLQPDLRVASVLESMGCRVDMNDTRVQIDAGGVELGGVEVDMSSAPDGALAVAVACLFAASPSRISGLESLRHKESDRLQAITSEIRRIGGDVEARDDVLEIRPSRLRGAVVDPHGDHRIAMSLAVAGTVVPDLSVANPKVVDKTWPGFWDLLQQLRT